MKINNLRACVILLALAFSIGGISEADALSIGDVNDLGLINPNHPADPTDTASFVDILLDRPLNSGPTTIGANQYTRTGNDPLNGAYPDAVFGTEPSGAPTSINLGSGYLYLVAKYDGPNYGSVVWYVGGMTGTVTIPSTATNGQYGLSHVYLYNPGHVSVPDGGATLALLGLGLVAVEGVRRRMTSFAV